MTVALAKGMAITVLCSSTFTRVFCSTFRFLSDSHSHDIRVLGHKNLSQIRAKRSKGLKSMQMFPVDGTSWQLFSSFNLYFSLQADVSTAGTSCSSFVFAMLPVNDHCSWSSWKVWQMLNQVLMEDFSAWYSPSLILMKMWGGVNACWEKGKAEGCLLWLCDY